MNVHNFYRSLGPSDLDKRVSKTFSAIIAALCDEGHHGLLEQDFIGHHLHCIDVSEFIHCDLYGSLVKILQDDCFDVSKS